MASDKGRILLAVTGLRPGSLAARNSSALQPERGCRRRSPTAPDDPSIDYAVVVEAAAGRPAALPNLKAIFSLGAGVDHIFADPRLPDVPIVRIVADDLTERMSEYVVWQVLDHHRQGLLYRDQQAQQDLARAAMQPAAADITVGIMGLGVLGPRRRAASCCMLGFKVTGWSRTRKQDEGVDMLRTATTGSTPFSRATDIVVVLLPLTPATRGICQHATSSRKMKRANAARRAGADQCRTRRPADRGRHPAALDERHADGARASTCSRPSRCRRQPAMDPSAVYDHAACGGCVDPALVPPMVAQMDAHRPRRAAAKSGRPRRRLLNFRADGRPKSAIRIARLDAGDRLGQRLAASPSWCGRWHAACAVAVDHDADMALPEDQIAAPQADESRPGSIALPTAPPACRNRAAPCGRHAHRKLDEAGAIDAEAGGAAPEIGRVEERAATAT